MVARATVCVRRLAGGCRAQRVRYGRFLANPKVTVAALLDGWGEQTARAAGGRHGLAIQSLPRRRPGTPARFISARPRGAGAAWARLAMAISMVCWCMPWWRWMRPPAAVLDWSAPFDRLRRVWTRSGPVTVTHNRRALADKESERWIATALRAQDVLAMATRVTVIADRESDLYAAL